MRENRWRLMAGVGVAVVLAGVAVRAETYRVTVTRKETNLYRIDGTKSYVKTRYCYEYVTGEDALLRYQAGAYDNKLIFDKRSMVTSCDVEKLLTEQ